MKLHLDTNAIRVLLNEIHEKTGYRLDVLEKDYYVVLMLKELAEKQQAGLKAYFKGGTALYKALKTTNRFSEDIDLSVDTRECSRTQNDKRLENSTKRYQSLERISDEGRTNRSEVIAVYRYEPIVAYDKDDALQRFGKLKLEATSFTISEPTMSMEIAPMIYELATDEQKAILGSHYDVSPFYVQTMTLERIFVDKLFATESYVQKSAEPHRAFEAAKHIYDLSVIARHPVIQALYENETQMGILLQIRLEEEKSRLDGVGNTQPKDFVFHTQLIANSKVAAAYEIMQKQYVFRECDRIPYETAITNMEFIFSQLENNKAWITPQNYFRSQETVAPKKSKSRDYER